MTRPMTPASLLLLARAATPGPWKVSTSHGFCIVRDVEDGDMIADMCVDYDAGRWEGKPADAAFIAAASPDVVAALCLRVEELEHTVRHHSEVIAEAYDSMECERLHLERIERLVIDNAPDLIMPVNDSRYESSVDGILATSRVGDAAAGLAARLAKQAARISALEAGLREACDLYPRAWTAGASRAGDYERIAALRKLAEGKP